MEETDGPAPSELSRAPDRDVIALARQGREDAYRQILQRYQRPVFALIRRLVRHRELAEELTQDTFTKAFAALDSFRPDHKFSPWILRIANNTAVEHLRQKQLETVPLEITPQGTPSGRVRVRTIRSATPLTPTPAPRDLRQVRPALEQAMRHLRSKDRRCVRLRYLEERSYENIAEIMDLPLGSVKTCLHRARKELNALLAPLRGLSRPITP